MTGSANLTISLFEYLVIPLGQISLLLFGIMGIYLVIKYKSLSFWWSATKKEMVFVKIGLCGFLVFGLIGVIMAIFSEG